MRGSRGFKSLGVGGVAWWKGGSEEGREEEGEGEGGVGKLKVFKANYQ